MNPLESPDFDDHEHVSFFSDSRAGLRAIIAVHSTLPMGISGGGVRMWPYRDGDAALRDALRLSKAMSYKLALMGIPAGGGKAVILGDPARDKSEALLRAFGRAVHRLNGKFVAGEDVGTTPADMAVMARETPFVVGSDGNDSAPSTARGVLIAIRTALAVSGRALFGTRVLVQGVGKVGSALARDLADEGAVVLVTDKNRVAVERLVRETGAVAVDPDEALDVEVDVLAPCALGDVFDELSVARLRCAIVAGSANDQLADDAAADRLAARGILYCPDFVVNAGGVVGAARQGASAAGPFASAFADLDRIGTLLREIFARAERESVSTHTAAVRTAREALARARG